MEATRDLVVVGVSRLWGLGVGFSPGGLLTSWGSCVASRGEGSQKFGWGNFLASKPILACILACPSAFCCNFGFGVSFTGYDDDVQRERDQDFAA